MHPSDKELEKKGEEATVIKSKVRKVRMWKPGLILGSYSTILWREILMILTDLGNNLSQKYSQHYTVEIGVEQ